MSDLVELVDLPDLGDCRGGLVAIEAQETIPFDVKRVYYIFGTNGGVSRGFHAHRELQQLAVCVSGSCLMRLDDGKTQAEILLESPTKGLLIKHLVWREMHKFTPDCVLLVLASEAYNEDDYIRDYEAFIDEARS